MKDGHARRVLLRGINAVVVVAVAGACSRNPAPQAAAEPDDVVVGYGTQDRAEVTGSVASISEAEVARARVKSIEELIRGRVAGVQVLRKANGEYSVRVRGMSSLVGDGEPLFVIDGVPLSQQGVSTAIATMSPADVARIDVLKDAGSAAIYGSRAANGVILITTRRSN